MWIYNIYNNLLQSGDYHILAALLNDKAKKSYLGYLDIAYVLVLLKSPQTNKFAIHLLKTVNLDNSVHRHQIWIRHVRCMLALKTAIDIMTKKHKTQKNFIYLYSLAIYACHFNDTIILALVAPIFSQYRPNYLSNILFFIRFSSSIPPEVKLFLEILKEA